MIAFKWWAKEPLRFECQKGCNTCCNRPGVVYFSKEDIAAAANFLNIPQSEFKMKYLDRVNDSWFIDVGNNPCPFLTLNGCGIHSAKPQQCRAYPFWRENLLTRKQWKITAEICPGIGVGPAIPLDIITDFYEKDV